MLRPFNRIRLTLSITKCSSFSEERILPICSALPFHFKYFNYKCLVSFNLNWWSTLVLLRFFKLFFAKFYLANYYYCSFFFDKIWKHDTCFSVNVHYNCLLLLILLKSYISSDLEISRSIHLHKQKYTKGFTL